VIRARSLAAAVAALIAVPALASAHGGEVHETEPPGWDAWSVPPFEVGLIVVAAVLYAVRVRRLGSRVASWRPWCFGTGLAIMLLALVSPVDAVGERGLFAVHMLQHVAIGDLAPLFIVLGLTGPVLRPVLAVRWVESLRVLAHPVIAFTLWTASLVFWHLPFAYEAAIGNSAVHFLEHACFIGFGLLMWAAMIEVLPAPQWFGTGAKVAYVAAVRVVTTVLGNVYWWSSTVFYESYASTAPHYGFTALEDQANAGTVMMVESGLVTLAFLVILFFRLAKEGELRQSLLEQGLPADQVSRAIRYGRGEALGRKSGATAATLPSSFNERNTPDA
jgi:putative membrane protein